MKKIGKNKNGEESSASLHANSNRGDRYFIGRPGQIYRRLGFVALFATKLSSMIRGQGCQEVGTALIRSSVTTMRGRAASTCLPTYVRQL